MCIFVCNDPLKSMLLLYFQSFHNIMPELSQISVRKRNDIIFGVII